MTRRQAVESFDEQGPEEEKKANPFAGLSIGGNAPATTGSVAEHAPVFDPEAVDPTVMQPVDEIPEPEEGEPEPQIPGRRTIGAPVIAAGVVAALLIVAGGAYGTVTWREAGAYETAVAQTDDAFDELSQAIRKAETLSKEVSSEKLDDESALKALSEAIKEAKAVRMPSKDANRWMYWQLKSGSADLTQASQQARDLAEKLKTATAQVRKAKDAKTLSDAKAELDDTLQLAQETLDGSVDQVADEATRTALAELIEKASKTNSGKAEDLQTLTADLKDAMA